MSTIVAGASRAISTRSLIWLFHVALPMLGLWLLVAQPQLDLAWEDHFWHFWLVFVTAAIDVALAILIGEAAHRRADARLYLVSLSFLTAAGFLALHALATPAVILASSNAGFLLATPIGVALAGLFALASARELTASQSARILRLRPLLTGGVILILAAWQLVTLFGAAILVHPLPVAEARGLLIALAAIGVVCYTLAAILYYRLYRRRPSAVALSVITAFVLLAELMIAMTSDRIWHASWWEWHVLMTLAFGFVAYTVDVQYRREGRVSAVFSSISLEDTVRQLREEYGEALDQLVDSIEDAADTGGAARRASRPRD